MNHTNSPPVALNYETPRPRPDAYAVVGWGLFASIVLFVSGVATVAFGIMGLFVLLFLSMPIWTVFGAMIKGRRYRP